MVENAKFTLIDMENWDRAEAFERFTTSRRCAYDLVSNVDITGLKELCRANGLRFFPVMVYFVARVMNAHTEYRCALDAEQRLGYYEVLHPKYTVFQEDTRKFAEVMTVYDADFDTFYRRAVADIEMYGRSLVMFGQGKLPDSRFSITSIPWRTFTGVGYHVYDDGTYMIPFTILGRYFEENGKRLIPVNVQFHHAVCDGYHAARFFNELEELIRTFVCRGK